MAWGGGDQREESYGCNKLAIRTAGNGGNASFYRRVLGIHIKRVQELTAIRQFGESRRGVNKRWLTNLASLNIPDFDSLVTTARAEPLAIARKIERINILSVTGEGVTNLLCLDIPDLFDGMEVSEI